MKTKFTAISEYATRMSFNMRQLCITGLSIVILTTIGITSEVGSNSFKNNLEQFGQSMNHSMEESAYTELQLVHSSADPAIDELDVYLNGDPSNGDPDISELSYKEATEFFEIQSGGEITIILTRAGSEEVIYSENLTLKRSEKYIGVIRGDFEVMAKASLIQSGHSDLEVDLLKSRDSDEESDELPLMFYHAVSDFPTIDIWGAQRNIYAENLSFGESSANYVHFPTGTIEFNYHNAGMCPVFDSPVFTFEKYTGNEADVTGLAIISGYAELSAVQDLPEAELMVVFSDGRTMFPQNITSAEIEQEADVPHEVTLSQNYPNPFNSVTMIEYHIPVDSYVELNVYSLLGRQIKTLVNADTEAGTHQVSFDGSDITTGVYLYRLQAGNEVLTNKMIMVK